MTRPDYARREADGPCPDVASKAAVSNGDDGAETPLSVRVVETVADALGADAMELGPLYDVIDPDALDLLFEPPRRSTGGRVTFTFEGCTVTVDADGRVAASPGANDGE